MTRSIRCPKTPILLDKQAGNKHLVKDTGEECILGDTVRGKRCTEHRRLVRAEQNDISGGERIGVRAGGPVPKHPSMLPCIHPRPASVRKPPNCVRAHLGTVRVRSGRGEIAGNRSRSGHASADGLAGMTGKKRQSSAEKNCREGGRRRKEEGSSSRVLVPR